ncbi:MAG: hypothetical protein CVV46_07260 [Spirochaetae bacterium HGW-Spirochaetae-2]|nr:MAG: hypothetical protein CVV46_07260 [Spirochaetae bacterium HGW-Spirochaetae-2]
MIGNSHHGKGRHAGAFPLLCPRFGRDRYCWPVFRFRAEFDRFGSCLTLFIGFFLNTIAHGYTMRHHLQEV